MLRIERSNEKIRFTLWGNHAGRERVYAATPENIARLESMIAVAKTRRQVQTFDQGVTVVYKAHHYRIVNGLYFDERAPLVICRMIESLMRSGLRLKIWYGDTESGRAWDDRPAFGRIGRTTGRIKSPILVYNARAMGGGIILDYCIVRIDCANRKDGGTLYQHPLFHVNPEGEE